MLLAACGAPITNGPLVEEALFIDALPTDARMGVPDLVRRARVGDSAVLEAAVVHAAEYEWLVATLIASGEALAAEPPADRATDRRHWDAVPAGTRIGADTLSWYVRGDVRRPGDADLSFTLELALGEGGPWELIGGGRHDPGGYGEAAWDIDRLVALFDLDASGPIGELALAYDVSGSARALEAELPPIAGFPKQYAASGDVAWSWTGWFAVEPDGDVLPGVGTVVQSAFGGRGVGVRYAGEEERPFEACWTADGDTVWLAGAGLVEQGESRACAIEAWE
ncbi:MAG: hypothetical protein ACI8PZ_007247 [Myxococcota bacterium]